MSTILVIREQMKKLYARYSFYIRRIAQLILGLLVFGLINANIGFMSTASSPVVTIALAVICAFLPLTIMMIAATALILLHLYVLAMPTAIMAAFFFLVMYIFYFRFSNGRSWIVLLMGVALALKCPIVMIVAIGLLGTPVCAIPAALGTFTYYMIDLVKTSSGTFRMEETAEMVESMTTFARQVLMNRAMWVLLVAVIIGILLVYGIRTRSVDHAWKIATASGMVAGVAICLLGDMIWSIQLNYVTLAIDAVLAVAAGLILELLFLSVDYSRTERVEFEDDEYHYYVKAVPKIGVSTPEKNVKHITDDAGGNSKQEGTRRGNRKRGSRQASVDEDDLGEEENTEDLLLTRSLNKELGLDPSDDQK